MKWTPSQNWVSYFPNSLFGCQKSIAVRIRPLVITMVARSVRMRSFSSVFSSFHLNSIFVWFKSAASARDGWTIHQNLKLMLSQDVRQFSYGEADNFLLPIYFFIGLFNLAYFSWGCWLVTVDLKEDRMRNLSFLDYESHEEMIGCPFEWTQRQYRYCSIRIPNGRASDRGCEERCLLFR